MGLKYIYQGKIYDESAYENPVGGSTRLNIRTGPGVSDVAKYGLTSDSSASEYCKMTFNVNGQKAWLGRTMTVSSASEYETSRVSEYNTTRQSNYTDWRASWYTATGTDYTYSHTYTTREYNNYTSTTSYYTYTYTAQRNTSYYAYQTRVTYVGVNYYTKVYSSYAAYGLVDNQMGLNQTYYGGSVPRSGWRDEYLWNATSSTYWIGYGNLGEARMVPGGVAETKYAGHWFTWYTVYETISTAYGAAEYVLTRETTVKTTYNSSPYYRSSSQTYRTQSSYRTTYTSWDSPYYSSATYTYYTTRTSGYNTSRASNYGTTRSSNYMMTTSGSGTTHNFNI